MSDLALEPVKVAVIGAGLIGRRHIKHVHKESSTSLAAIVEPSAAGIKLAREYDVPHFESLGKLLESTTVVDAVILGTPTHTHVSLALLCLQNDKHVLVEKPVASSVEEGNTLLSAVQSSKARVIVGHHRRFNPYVVRLRKALTDGKLGRVLGVTGVWSSLKPSSWYDVDWRTSPPGGGPIAINLIHDVDLLRHLCSDIVKVYAEEGQRTRSFPVEETGVVTLKFANGAVGTFFFSDSTPSPFSFEGATGENPDLIGYYGQNTYTIFGTDGTIQFPELKRYSFDHLQETQEKGWHHTLSVDESYARVDASIPPFTKQLQHFVRVCRGDEEPMCSAEEGLKSLAVLEAIRKSLLSGSPVEL